MYKSRFSRSFLMSRTLLAHLVFSLFILGSTLTAPAFSREQIATNTEVLVPFNSAEGLARLASSNAKADFAALANQFEAQYNAIFCGPASAAIVLNTLAKGNQKLPRDTNRLQSKDTKYLSADFNPIIPRHTQDSVITKGKKTRAQVLGEPLNIKGKLISDMGYQLRQFDEMLAANGLKTQLTIVNNSKTESLIRAALIANLQNPNDFVIINYRRQELGQQGGGHISPLAAYDQASDSFLILDVNPANADWVWAPASTLIKAMKTFDQIENRGFVEVATPPDLTPQNPQ